MSELALPVEVGHPPSLVRALQVAGAVGVVVVPLGLDVGGVQPRGQLLMWVRGEEVLLL